MKKRLPILGLLLFSIVFSSSGQGINGDPTPKTRLIPPSPEAATLGRYAANPPSFYTGSPQISMPLAEVTQGSIHVPISLSYNASGNRVEDMASWVGLGWALNAGGVITRSARGAADDQQPSSPTGRFTNFFDITHAISYEDLVNAAPDGQSLLPGPLVLTRSSQGCADTQPDVFYFNFNGYTGQFSFDWQRKIQVSTAKDIRIEPVFNERPVPVAGGATAKPGSIINEWRVTTESGTVYTFAATETTTNKPTGHNVSGCIPTSGHQFISSWYLSSIEDVNKEHWVKFDYVPYQLSYGLRFNHTIENGIGDCASNSDAGVDRSSSSSLTVAGVRPWRIRTSSGNTEVELVPETARRTDTVGVVGGRNGNLHALDHLVVRNSAGIETRTVFLSYYPNHPTGRLTLKGIQEGRMTGERLPGHVFSYNTATALPEDIRSLVQDHWGYYNGATGAGNGLSLVPGCSLPGINGHVINEPGANREVDTVAAQAGILTRVQYPTGGYSTYQYESNEYGYINARTVESLGQVKTNRVSYSVAAGGGDEGTPIPSTNGTPLAWSCFEYRRPFSILPLKNAPVSTGNGSTLPADPRIGVSVTMNILNPCGYVGGHRPYVALLDSAGQQVFRVYGGGAGASVVDDRSVRMLYPGRYTMVAYACRLNSVPICPGDDSGINTAELVVEFNSPGEPIIKKVAGGLRIKKIRDYSSTSDDRFSEKTFTYAEAARPKGSSGCIYGEPKYAYLSKYVWLKTDGIRPGDQPAPTICDCWFRVAHNRTSLGSTQGSLVGYRHVTVTNIVDQQPYNQTVYKFTSPVEYPDSIVDQLPFPPATSQSYRTGLLSEQTDYRGVGTNRTRLRTATTRYQFYEIATPGLAVSFPLASPTGTVAGSLPLLRKEYQLILGHSQADSVRETQYDSDGTLKLLKDKVFTYNATGTRLQSEAFPLMAGVRQLIRHWYTTDFPVVPNSLYNRMANELHVIAPVETLTLVERNNTTNITGAVFHEFGFNGSKLHTLGERRLVTAAPLLASTYRIAATSSTPDPRLERYLAIDAHDKQSNVTQLHQVGGLPVARLWGYRQTQLVGEAVGATYNQVAATSFEPDSPGRWRYDLANTTADGHTGLRAYRLGTSTPVVRDSLPAGDYRLTCWATVMPTVTVNNTLVTVVSPTGSADAHGFRLYEWHLNSINDQATVNLTGSGLLDELRLAPMRAQFVTYTYTPLVGMTSQTDPSGRTTTYEYDALGRLLRTRDEQGRILGQRQYHYSRP